MSTITSISAPGLIRKLPSFRPYRAHQEGDPGAPPSQVIEGVPSGHGFVALLAAFRASGGTAPGASVRRLLAERPAAEVISLAGLLFSDQVFGFAWRSSLWIPMFQFNAGDLSTKSGPQQVRAALPLLPSGWAVAAWFASPNALLDAQKPIDLIDVDLEAVLHAARALPKPIGVMHRINPPVQRDSP